eukprot:gene11077-biopygen1807
MPGQLTLRAGIHGKERVLGTSGTRPTGCARCCFSGISGGAAVAGACCAAVRRAGAAPARSCGNCSQGSLPRCWSRSEPLASLLPLRNCSFLWGNGGYSV